MRKLMIAAASLALTACVSGGVMTVFTYQDTAYSQSLVQFEAANGKFPTQIVGDPFPTKVSNQTIANAIELPGWVGEAKLNLDGITPETANTRLVLAFNPANPNMSFDPLCKNLSGVALRPADGKELIVMATLCSGARAIAFTEGKGPAATGVDDPAFKQLMFQTMNDALPGYGKGRAFAGGGGGGR